MRPFFVAALITLSSACTGLPNAPPDLDPSIGDGAPGSNDPPGSSSKDPGSPTKADGGAANTGTSYAALAAAVHGYTTSHLLTPAGSVRVNPTSVRTDATDNASQISADAAMIVLGNADYAKTMNATYAFMGHYWNVDASTGGYYAECDVDGTNVSKPNQFVDDNSLAGLAYLDAADVTTDAAHDAYVQSASAIANWLMYEGVYDDTYGGGFWWSTASPDPGGTERTKPTQSNGLAAQLFARLYLLTGQPYYLSWASAIANWLDKTLFDTATSLYAWNIGAPGVDATRFTQDQAIMIEAHLWLARATKDGLHLARAKAVATALAKSPLHDRGRGGFLISTQDPRRSPVYSGWATEAYTRLFEVDHDTQWLDHAQENVDVLIAQLRDPATGAFHAKCDADGGNASQDYVAVDQAWMQRALASFGRHVPEQQAKN